MLRVSESTVRRLEKTVLPPVIIEQVRYQREQDVREYLQRSRSAREGVEPTDGATTAEAFELFDSGLGAADVVRRLKITSQAVRTLQRDWADLRGGFVVGGEAAVKLERSSLLTGNFPLASGEELVAMLAKNAPDKCRACEDRPPQFCGRCAVARRSAVERLLEADQTEREAKRQVQAARALSRQTVKLAQEVAEDASAGANK